MLVTLDGPRAVRVAGDPAHPFTRGFLCHRVTRYLERVYHPGRLTHPLRRVGPKGSGEFQQITWDAALDEIAAKGCGQLWLNPGTTDAEVRARAAELGLNAGIKLIDIVPA